MKNRVIERIFDLTMELKREQSKLDVLHRIHEDETEEFKAISETCREKEKQLSNVCFANLPKFGNVLLEKCFEDKIVVGCAFSHYEVDYKKHGNFNSYYLGMSILRAEIKPSFVEPYFKLRILKISWGARGIDKSKVKSEWIEKLTGALNSPVKQAG